MIGDASLSRRPMRRVIEPLDAHGRAHRGHRRPRAADDSRRAAARPSPIVPTVPSAQVKSAVLLAGLQAEGTTSVTEPAQTRDHTERALAAFGVEVDGRTASRCRSTAASAAAAQTSVGARRLLVGRVLDGRGGRAARLAHRDRGRRPQPDADRPARRAAALRRPGRGARDGDRRPASRAAPSSSRATGPGRVEIAPDEVPGLIDELPALAALAAHGGEVSVRGAAELRVKESDRIAVARGRLPRARHRRRRAPRRLRHPRRRARRRAAWPTRSGDHRMAMAFAIAALAGARAVAHRRRRCRRAFPIPASSRRSSGSSREGRQGLPRRVHGRRQDDRRPARSPGGSAGRSRTSTS